jgi:competence protein ComEA
MTFTVLGGMALVALGVLTWLQQRPPITVKGTPSPAQGATWDRQLEAARQIDVNAATVAELERLPGVGPTLARRIVEYRSAHGPFAAADDLGRVPGIGPKTVDALRAYVTVR